MKQVFKFLLLILVGYSANAQFPAQQTLGNNRTMVISRGGLKGDSGIVTAKYATLPPLTAAISGYEGALIQVGDSLYLRSNGNWVNVTGSGGSSIIPTWEETLQEGATATTLPIIRRSFIGSSLRFENPANSQTLSLVIGTRSDTNTVLTAPIRSGRLATWSQRIECVNDSLFAYDEGVRYWTGELCDDSVGTDNIVAGNQIVRNGDTLGLRSSSPGASNALWFNPNLGSFAAGFNNIASGINSVALGSSKASGDYSAAIGDNVQNPNNASLVIGDYNDPTNNVSNDVVFQAARNNVNRFEVRGNGQLLINDGTQQSGYVLTSDANGVTSWQAPASGADSTIFATQFRLDTVKANRVIIGSDAELRSLHITGPNGAGKLELRHQASLPTAGGQTTSVYANSNGNLAWKNDNLHHTTLATNHITADRSYRFQNKSYTLADSAVVLNQTDSTGNTGFTSLFQYNKGKDSLRALIPTAGWGVTGNAGTNATTNFIGTTDNVNLVFRTNNVERMRITNTTLDLGSSVNALTIQNTGFDMVGNGAVQFRGFGGTNVGFINTASRTGLSLGTTSELSGGALSFWSNATRIANATTTGRWAIGSAAPNASATLDVQGTTGGFLPPRMTTTQRDAIASPADGLQIYNTTTSTQDFYRSTAWHQLLHTAGGQTISGALTISAASQLNVNNIWSISGSLMQFYANGGFDFDTPNSVSLGASGTRLLSNFKGSYSKTGGGSEALTSIQIRPTISLTSGTTTLRGLMYNPNITNSTGLTEIAIETVRGDVLIGTTSGRLAVGAATPSAINTNAAMQVVSTSRGFMPPVMTTAQRDAVTWVAGDAGMIIYNSTTNKHQGYNGTTWNDLY